MVKRFLKDEGAKRRFWLGFLIIVAIGGLVTYFSVNGVNQPTKRRGGLIMTFNNRTYYEVHVDAELYNPLGKPHVIDLTITAGAIKTYEHHEGSHLRLGRKGNVFKLKVTKVADASQVLLKDIVFDGFEGDNVIGDEIRVKRRWDKDHWLLLIEDI